MRDVSSMNDVAYSRELFQSIAPFTAMQQQPSSRPKITTVGVHFDETTVRTEARKSGVVDTVTPTRTSSATPFSDGITIKRSWFKNMPKRFALSMQWPLDVPGYNLARRHDGRGEGGGSLVYYRALYDLHKSSASDYVARFISADDRLPGEVLLRVTCEKPCWTTNSKRYAGPIKVALGTDGPVLWEAWPTSTGNKKKDHSDWTLRCADDDFACKLRTEDILGQIFSVGDQRENVYTLSAKLETTITTQARGGDAELVSVDAGVDAHLVYFNVNHANMADGNKFWQNASCVAFLVAFLEASQAIRDEEAGGGSCRGRRDVHGRLMTVPGGGLKKLFNK